MDEKTDTEERDHTKLNPVLAARFLAAVRDWMNSQPNKSDTSEIVAPVHLSLTREMRFGSEVDIENGCENE